MHPDNMAFWQYCKNKYSRYFSGSRTLEVGSYNVNGSVRELFDSNEYIGVDWRPGPGVDHVSFAHEMNLGKFDTIISSSMLEHDIYWEKSVDSMIDHMKQDGILMLSWGCAASRKHCPDHAPDNKYHALKAGLVINALSKKSIYIHELWYEGSFVLNVLNRRRRRRQPLWGNIYVVAFLDKQYAIGDPFIDSLTDNDKV